MCQAFYVHYFLIVLGGKDLLFSFTDVVMTVQNS